MWSGDAGDPGLEGKGTCWRVGRFAVKVLICEGYDKSKNKEQACCLNSNTAQGILRYGLHGSVLG